MKNKMKLEIANTNTRPTGRNGQHKLEKGNETPGPKAAASVRRERKRLRPERMTQIFAWLKDGKYPNCSTIAALFKVSARTAKRDIDVMRERWGLPIAYDDRLYGFYLDQPMDGSRGLSLTEKELFTLCVAHKVIEQYRGTALQQMLEQTFQKFTDQLNNQERFTLKNVIEAMSFPPFSPEEADLLRFEQIARRENQSIGKIHLANN
jgi:predicted DNA-binding transcriptional regulator YafY